MDMQGNIYDLAGNFIGTTDGDGNGIGGGDDGAGHDGMHDDEEQYMDGGDME